MARQPPPEATADALWQSCPPGEFSRLSDKLRARSQRRTFLQVAGLTAAAAATAGGAWLVLGPGPTPADPGGIPCSEVHRLADDYAKGKVSGCLAEQIRTHLSQCPDCAARYQAPEPCTQIPTP